MSKKTTISAGALVLAILLALVFWLIGRDD